MQISRVGAIKANDTIDMPDALVLHSDETSRTITLNGDDVVTDYLDDSDTLALKSNNKFG